MVGAASLRARAAALEAAILNELPAADVEAMCRAADEELTALIDDIAERLRPSVEAESPATDWARVRSLIAELEALLDAGNFEANVLAARNAALLDAALGDASREIRHLIAAFDYGPALAALRAAQAGIADIEPRPGD
jgi:hypothetical protein